MGRFFTLAATVALSLGAARAEQLQNCGVARYYASQYTCYNGDSLCPVVGGERTLQCSNACYSPSMYSCSNGNLDLLPYYSGPFTMVAVANAPFNGEPINACDRHFWVGGGACTYCPYPSVPYTTCEIFTNTTVLFAGAAMDTEVPGGQQYYVEANGALGFTQAHSISVPTGAKFGETGVYDNGWFFFTGGASASDGWLACPETLPGTSNVQYQIFGKVAGETFNASCIPLNIRSVAQPQGTVGAWQYT